MSERFGVLVAICVELVWRGNGSAELSNRVSTGWRWTVYIPGRLKPKSGRAFDRQTAVRLAEIVIDRAIKVKLTKPPQH
jgi:hypothetical protein